MNEADFKAGFRKDLILAAAALPHGTLMTWTNTDQFRHGLPDFFTSYRGIVLACEAKAVKKLPQRETSRVLDREVDLSQIQFLNQYASTGSPSVLLIEIGGDVAVYTQDFKPNYTLREILDMPRICRTRGHWDVLGFLTEFFDG